MGATALPDSSDGKRARPVVALARNLDLLGSRFLARLTAVLVASLRQTPAWKVCAFALLICRHH